MHFALQDREEDGERRNKIPNKHCERIAVLGGSVMFWGCFNSRGPGALVKIDGIMNSTKYQAIFF